MRPGWVWGAAVVLALAAAPPASAHDLECDKTVRLNDATAGERLVEVHGYPARLSYEWEVTDLHPTAVSYLQWERDSLLFPAPRAPEGAGPDGLAIGDTPYVHGGSITIETYEQCADLANVTPAPGQIVILDNRYSAGFDRGEAQCTARVLCFPPELPGWATRTMGFFKTHVDAAAQCLGGGELVTPIDLGFTSIEGEPAAALSELLGLLWATPGAYQGLDKARLLLARQLVVATCNERLFGADAGTLVEAAQAALAGASCADILALVAAVDAFNESGDDNPFPVGFVPGAAAPTEAQALAAAEPITPSGLGCTP